ncbi:MAG: hypothetical protein JWP97_5066 [Labilithrix sp.]|nr:hypothetical protein [Labilithrix sp.]
MASQPPPGPVPAPPDALGDAQPQGPAALAVPAEVPALDEVIVVKPNDALDVLVARDAALAAEHGSAELPAGPPPPKATPAQEWGAAVVLMVIFLILSLAAVSFFRG